MLKFNPLERFTAEQCLESPIFDKIRSASKEAEISCEPIDCVDNFENSKAAAEYLIE